MQRAILFIIATMLYLHLSASDTDKADSLATGSGKMTDWPSSYVLPLLEITTIDEEEPTCSYVFHPEGAFGISITNATKVPGRAVLTLNNITIFDSGEYEKDKSGMTIKIRGNTSAYNHAKKPFKIKLQKKGDMLCRGEERFYDKDWVLICDGDDTFKAMVGYKVSELFGLGWTPAYKYVNLVINGDYRGIYMLIESVNRNADCRINVDKRSGYVFECDAYWWNENLYFRTPENHYYTFKYPDPDKITDEQVDYIKRTMEQVELSIADGTYSRYIDVSSFAAWLLAHDVLGTQDAGGANIYLTKYDSTRQSKVKMATLWDFDSTMKFVNLEKWANVHFDSFFYFKDLLGDSTSYFNYCYKKLWQEKSDSIFSALYHFFDEFLSSYTRYGIDNSRKYDQQRWGYQHGNSRDDIRQYHEWFEKRKPWLDRAISNIPSDSASAVMAGISLPPYAERRNKDTQLYTISGQKVTTGSALRPGIYLRNGKKFFVK